MSSEMFQTLPWPFPNDEFPDELGAVVMKSVLEGKLPALQVLHDPEGGWAVADGVGDPNELSGLTVTHIRHVTSLDPSLNQLATMPPGTVADRENVGGAWELSAFARDD